MTLSVIIPTYNEAEQIGRLVGYLREKAGLEVIVADGGSTDGTVQEATQAGARVIRSPRKGRGAQMNAGAATATGEVLYFLHADSYPPENFATEIARAQQLGYGSGCYQLDFDHSHWFLKLNCWFTRFNVNAVRFGDQSLFVRKDIFQRIGGYREDLIVLEDQEIIRRIRQQTRFLVFSGCVVTSARKYLANGIYRMQAVFFLIWTMYQLGFSQEQLVSTYRKMIRQDKI